MVEWKMDDRQHIDIYGIHVVQSWYDLFFINCILQYEKPRFDIIIEFGGGVGSSTLFFALNSHDAPVYTFDTRPESKYYIYQNLKSVLPITHYQRDLFSDETEKLVKKLIQKEKKKTLIYCDNGNKPREFNTYAKYMRKGDVIMSHDARVEIHINEIEETIFSCGLTPYHQDKSDEFGARIFCFKKTL